MYNHAIILFDKFSNFIGNLAFENIKYKHGLLIFKQLKLNFFFFLPGFSSQTLTIHRTAGEGRGPSFIPLYHFHPLTNIATFIFQFFEKVFIFQKICFKVELLETFVISSGRHLKTCRSLRRRAILKNL